MGDGGMGGVTENRELVSALSLRLHPHLHNTPKGETEYAKTKRPTRTVHQHEATPFPFSFAFFFFFLFFFTWKGSTPDQVGGVVFEGFLMRSGGAN